MTDVISRVGVLGGEGGAKNWDRMVVASVLGEQISR